MLIILAIAMICSGLWFNFIIADIINANLYRYSTGKVNEELEMQKARFKTFITIIACLCWAIYITYN